MSLSGTYLYIIRELYLVLRFNNGSNCENLSISVNVYRNIFIFGLSIQINVLYHCRKKELKFRTMICYFTPTIFKASVWTTGENFLSQVAAVVND